MKARALFATTMLGLLSLSAVSLAGTGVIHNPGGFSGAPPVAEGETEGIVDGTKDIWIYCDPGPKCYEYSGDTFWYYWYDSTAPVNQDPGLTTDTEYHINKI